jgi:transposase-like protein
MQKDYQIADVKDSRKLAELLSREGQLLLPMLELVEQAEMAIDELIDVMGRATVEAVLLMSAEEIAGPRRPGKKGGEVRWHGRQDGVVALSERKLRVSKPRLRKKGKGKNLEVSVPAYEAMHGDARLSERILAILMRGVSTRKYKDVLPQMAETVSVSKSSVSREFVEASERALQSLCERRFDEVDLLIIYIDGQVFGDHHIITAVGVDAQGRKHVLGMVEGATENGAAVTALLEDLIERGVNAERHRLFVIDGSKALRKGINAVFGKENPVQRCRSHKVRNVMGHLPEHLKEQVKASMKAAFKLSADEGIARLQKQAKWLELEHPTAAASLREGLDELFTVNRLGLSAGLRRCLTTTNLIESPHSGVRIRTGRVSRWRGGTMVLRWAAASFLDTEKNFRRIMGYRDLWMLKAHLNAIGEDSHVDMDSRAA